MKILLCNIPIRSYPSTFPPAGCTALINYLKKHGFHADFLDIDVKRPSDDELAALFSREQFDIVGISAVVSTGYAYTKKLASIIRAASPGTRIILGGNMAEAYEVVLRKTAIDVCAIGEGEKVLLALVCGLEGWRDPALAAATLGQIRGVAFLDQKTGLCVCTGHGEQLAPDELSQPDYDILAKYSDIEHYLEHFSKRCDFVCDHRSHSIERRGQKIAAVFSAKGCVNRCTFCHRWISGYRAYPVDSVIASIKRLRDKYGVGFFCFYDECFGEDPRWLDDFISKIKPLDILFFIGGARVTLLGRHPDLIRRLKAVGLTAVYFGMESGCEKILSVMDKKATREQNIKAARACFDAGVFTTIQLVIGMPGENDQTINETLDFVVRATCDQAVPPSLSVNYLQSLPGTACYDFLKLHRLVGASVDEEEKYLLDVSDVDACEFSQYMNVTESPLPRVRMWRQKIVFSARMAWLKRHGWTVKSEQVKDLFGVEPPARRQGMAELKYRIKTFPGTYFLMDCLGGFFWELLVFIHAVGFYGFFKAAGMLLGLWTENRDRFMVSGLSLRKILAK